MRVWIVREAAVAHINKSICQCGEQRARVSHLTFKNKWAIHTKGSLFPLQAKTQTHIAQKKLRAGPREGQLNDSRKTQIVGDSPGITSQMGTSRVCSKLAKLHSNFPSNTPSQSPIGLSWKSCRHEKHITLPGVLHLWKTDQAGATRASSPSIFLVVTKVCCLIALSKNDA